MARPEEPAVHGWPRVYTQLLAGEDLAPAAAAWAMDRIMSGEATDAQIAGFAIALRAKGETPAEVSSLVEVMLERSVRVTVPGRTVDIVGTGGDPIHAINISTLAAIVAAAAGARVVKHGNRAASSASGAADLLEQLGVAIELDPAGIAQCVEQVGIGFCFAPRFHPSLRYAAAPRRELGVPTVFNFLGPLSNPARPPAQAVGCSNERMAPVLAHALAARGTTGLVSRGDDGLDKLTTCGLTQVWVVSGGEVQRTSVDSVDLGIARSTPGELRGRDAVHNAAVSVALLDGAHGPVRDAVLLNAAAAIAAYDGIDGPLLDELRAGLTRATAALDSGAAAGLLARWVAVSQQVLPA
ncbi:MAG: anthranilate phosphoribosyltransferase [Mycobacteriales bacterium]